MVSKLGLLVVAVGWACLVQHTNASSIKGEKARRYIVRFEEPEGDVAAAKQAKSDVLSTFSTELRKNNLHITHQYDNVFQGFAVNLTDEVKIKLEEKYNIDIVEDGIVEASCKPPPPPPPPPAFWGLDRIDQRNLPLDSAIPPVYQGDGTDVHIYIVDTGIRKTHVEFENRVEDDGFTAFGGNFNTDCNGHGTHVAGTAAGRSYGVAKNARLHSVQVLGCDGSGFISDIIDGLDWIEGHLSTPAVVSMSLGGGPNSALDAAVESLIDSNIVVVVAAGNEHGDDACNKSPARTPDAITVGASTVSDAVADFSNVGSCVDIIAPGKGISSAGIANNDEITRKDGTSMACPHVSGAAAILLGLHPEWTPAEVWTELDRLSTKGKVTGLGSTTPNKLLFIGNEETTGGGPVDIPDGGPIDIPDGGPIDIPDEHIP